jgi:hypothetical protein
LWAQQDKYFLSGFQYRAGKADYLLLILLLVVVRPVQQQEFAEGVYNWV